MSVIDPRAAQAQWEETGADRVPCLCVSLTMVATLGRATTGAHRATVNQGPVRVGDRGRMVSSYGLPAGAGLPPSWVYLRAGTAQH